MQESLLSVGIDIGTSTSQLVFSRLSVENLAQNFAVPRIKITDKEIIYRSAVHFTPLLSEREIDAQALREIIISEYQKAQVTPQAVDTGAVIITGETARKENAAQVLEALSGLAGDFVVATAGADWEGIIAGKGAGADLWSKEKATRCLHIDIGGGTSNLAVFADGEAVDTGCMDIGGRLVKIKDGRITYIMPKIAQLIAEEKLSLAVGQKADVAALERLAEKMAELLAQSAGFLPINKQCRALATNKGLTVYALDYVSFSGGVADYIYPHEAEGDPFRFGDMGILLGEAIARSPLCQRPTVLPARETIGATVVGAGSHAMEVSGSTIAYSEQVFPLKNLPVLKLRAAEEGQMADLLPARWAWFPQETVAVAFKGKANPTFAEIAQYAQALAQGLRPYLTRNLPVVIVLEEDMAMALGQALRALLPAQTPLVCLDGVRVESGDYIDIGKPIAAGQALPVVVKTIVFHQ